MSWGERSCTHEFRCEPTFGTCNVDCEFYRWNGKCDPDSQFVQTKNKFQIRYKTMSPEKRKKFEEDLETLGIIGPASQALSPEERGSL